MTCSQYAPHFSSMSKHSKLPTNRQGEAMWELFFYRNIQNPYSRLLSFLEQVKLEVWSLIATILWWFHNLEENQCVIMHSFMIMKKGIYTPQPLPQHPYTYRHIFLFIYLFYFNFLIFKNVFNDLFLYISGFHFGGCDLFDFNFLFFKNVFNDLFLYISGFHLGGCDFRDYIIPIYT